MRSIVFAILVYFVCASITCNKTEEKDSETTVTNTLTVPSTAYTVYPSSSGAVRITGDKIYLINKMV